MWQRQIDVLQDDFFVIAYDTRGHGQSSVPALPWTIDDLAGDVLSLLDYLAVDKAHFCGISMGGLIGQWLAIHRADRLSSVVIANTASKIGQATAWQQRANLVRETGLATVAASSPSRWFSDDFIANHADVVAKLCDDLAASDAMGYAACCEVLAMTDLTDLLSAITVPLLVIAGTKDMVTTIADGQAIVQTVALARLVEIDASHISNIEKPVAFNQAVRDFCWHTLKCC